MMKVLIMEDDADFAQLLSEYLVQFDINVTNHESPRNALNDGLDGYDCLILDLTLPGIDGLEVCEEVRAKSHIPIIISSVRGDLSDKVMGSQIGADDHLPRPYGPKKIYARIISLVCRSKRIEENTKESVNSGSKVDKRRHETSCNGCPLTLIPAEYEILEYLISQHGLFISRKQLVSHCKSLRDRDSKSLDVVIGRLRAKIGDNLGALKYIFSVRGIGYKLVG